MVVKGNLKVELVRADTKTAFQEHVYGGSGMTFVESEPNEEYYISTQVLDDYDKEGARYLAFFNLDGKRLGCGVIMFKGQGHLAGLSEINNGVFSNRALKFVKTGVASRSLSDPMADTDADIAGSVSVSLYEAVFDETRELADFSSERPTKISKVAVDATETASKLAIRSAEGSHEIRGERKRGTGPVDYYKTGKLLETVDLKYCTTLGLIHVGILERPPFWEHNRLKHPRTDPIDPRLANIQPTIMHSRLEGDNGAVISQKEIELFDLSQLADSDDEDEGVDNTTTEPEATTPGSSFQVPSESMPAVVSQSP